MRGLHASFSIWMLPSDLHVSVPTRFFLQRFVPGARVLTDKETKGFLSAADDDSDGRIGADGEKI